MFIYHNKLKANIIACVRYQLHHFAYIPILTHLEAKALFNQPH